MKLCDFQLLENRIMKTVDSVYQVSYLKTESLAKSVCILTYKSSLITDLMSL